LREDLKVVCTEFSTLSLAVFVMSAISWYGQARPHLKLRIEYKDFNGNNLKKLKYGLNNNNTLYLDTSGGQLFN
jgi:hypothetical protein